MNFADCYPPEIVEWAQSLPEPECCTAQEQEIQRLLDAEIMIALGIGLRHRVAQAETREDANTAILNFRQLIQDAAMLHV